MKRNLIITLILLVLTGISAQAYAQNIMVSGKVTDSQTGASLKKVIVREKGTSTSTRTDSKGYYSVEIAIGKTLVFSREGYEDQEIKITLAGQLPESKTDEYTVEQNTGNSANANVMRVRAVDPLFGNNAPLVVVDGVPGVDMNTIQLSDIISIEILKDVSLSQVSK